MDASDYTRRIEECRGYLTAMARTILKNEYDSADAVQAALFVGWLKREQLRDINRFQQWMMQILINECRNVQRGWLRQSRIEQRLIANADTSKFNSEPLHTAMSCLPPEAYRLICARYLEGYSAAELARRDGGSRHRTQRRLKSAKDQLRQLMEEG